MLLLLSFIAASSTATALTFFFCNGLSLWWLLPVWLGYYVAAVLLYVIWLFSALLMTPQTDTPSKRLKNFYHWCEVHTLSWVMAQLGIRKKLVGAERLPDTPFLFVCNHRSAFDPIATFALFKKTQMCFVGKPEVFQVPVLGAAMRRAGFFPIDRENPRNAVTAIKHGAEVITQQERCMGIYPEGTRSRTGDLLPFHGGSFKIAKLADCPVVVASIRYEKRRVLPGYKRVHLHVVDVMDTDYVKENNTAAMAARADHRIREDLEM
ncbi:MAG: 1-acyl-sn-glycerol-3-phosphate acyltransferase [Ruminococcaceae bacterium]|nr:1-acyl-sn-glycerol-3-phosphate acyltransferase [Oscillospiraceae bacterium]